MTVACQKLDNSFWSCTHSNRCQVPSSRRVGGELDKSPNSPVFCSVDGLIDCQKRPVTDGLCPTLLWPPFGFLSICTALNEIFPNNYICTWYVHKSYFSFLNVMQKLSTLVNQTQDQGWPNCSLRASCGSSSRICSSQEVLKVFSRLTDDQINRNIQLHTAVIILPVCQFFHRSNKKSSRDLIVLQRIGSRYLVFMSNCGNAAPSFWKLSFAARTFYGVWPPLLKTSSMLCSVWEICNNIL